MVTAGTLWCILVQIKYADWWLTRLVSIVDRKAHKLRNRLASAMRIDMETWLGLTLRSSGRICDIHSQVAHVQLLWTPTKFVGLLRGMETKKRRFAMLLCFGGTVLVLLFYVRGSKVWHAQSRNPLEMLVGTSNANFPFLRNKGGSQWRQLWPEWKPQHRSGKNSQEVAYPTCCEACEPCDLLWKLTYRYCNLPDHRRYRLLRDFWRK